MVFVRVSHRIKNSPRRLHRALGQSAATARFACWEFSMKIKRLASSSVEIASPCQPSWDRFTVSAKDHVGAFAVV